MMRMSAYDALNGDLFEKQRSRKMKCVQCVLNFIGALHENMRCAQCIGVALVEVGAPGGVRCAHAGCVGYLVPQIDVFRRAQKIEQFQIDAQVLTCY